MCTVQENIHTWKRNIHFTILFLISCVFTCMDGAPDFLALSLVPSLQPDDEARAGTLFHSTKMFVDWIVYITLLLHGIKRLFVWGIVFRPWMFYLHLGFIRKVKTVPGFSTNKSYYWHFRFVYLSFVYFISANSRELLGCWPDVRWVCMLSCRKTHFDW